MRLSEIAPDDGFILATVSRVFGVSLRDIRDSARFRDIAEARHAVAYLLRIIPRLCGSQRGFGEIGALLGRDQSSIRHGCRRAIALCHESPAYAAAVGQARNAVLRRCRLRVPSFPAFADGGEPVFPGPVDHDGPVWCEQCDARVWPDRIGACASAFCPLQPGVD